MESRLARIRAGVHLTGPSTSAVVSASRKSVAMAASGSATRSVDECEMSRSCHSGMPSITGTTWARTTRASPQIRSERIGFRLCGIADEPFWP